MMSIATHTPSENYLNCENSKFESSNFPTIIIVFPCNLIEDSKYPFKTISIRNENHFPTTNVKCVLMKMVLIPELTRNEDGPK